MKTSAARVYPVKELILDNDMDIDQDSISITSQPMSKVITPRYLYSYTTIPPHEYLAIRCVSYRPRLFALLVFRFVC